MEAATTDKHAQRHVFGHGFRAIKGRVGVAAAGLQRAFFDHDRTNGLPIGRIAFALQFPNVATSADEVVIFNISRGCVPSILVPDGIYLI